MERENKQAQRDETVFAVQATDHLLGEIQIAAQALQEICDSTDTALEDKRQAFDQQKTVLDQLIKKANDCLKKNDQIQNSKKVQARKVIQSAATSSSLLDKKLFEQEQRATFQHLDEIVQTIHQKTEGEFQLPSERIEIFRTQSTELRTLECKYSRLLTDAAGEAKVVAIENALQVLFANLIDQYIATENEALQVAIKAISDVTQTKEALKNRQTGTSTETTKIANALRKARSLSDACKKRVDAFLEMKTLLEVIQGEAKTQQTSSERKLRTLEDARKKASETTVMQEVGASHATTAPATPKDNESRTWLEHFLSLQAALYIIQGFGLGGILAACVGMVLLGAALIPPVGIAASAIFGCIIAGSILLGGGCLIIAGAIYLVQKWQRTFGQAKSLLTENKLFSERQALSQQAAIEAEIKNFQAHETAITKKIQTVAGHLQDAEKALENVKQLSNTLQSHQAALEQNQTEAPVAAVRPAADTATTATVLAALTSSTARSPDGEPTSMASSADDSNPSAATAAHLQTIQAGPIPEPQSATHLATQFARAPHHPSALDAAQRYQQELLRQQTQQNKNPHYC
jgi:hypothetical protein